MAKKPQRDTRAHELEKPREGVQVSLFPAPISLKHLPGHAVLPSPLPKELDFFRPTTGRKEGYRRGSGGLCVCPSAITKGSGSEVHRHPCRRSQLNPTTRHITDVSNSVSPAESRSAENGQPLEIHAANFRMRKRSTRQGNRSWRARTPSTFCMPRFLRGPTSSNMHTGTHSTSALH